MEDDQHTLYDIYHAYARRPTDEDDGGSWETDMSADMKLADRIMDSSLGA